jgi:Virulence factor BrkB
LGPTAAPTNLFAVQHEPARQSGRGRHAQAPWQIPWQGWKDILWRTYEQIGEDLLGLQNLTGLLFRVARWPLLLLIVIFGLAVLYRYGPSRREPRWQWISVGSAFASVAWLISSASLSWYLASFADYDATYGSLGPGIGMNFSNCDPVRGAAEFRD